MSNAAVNALAVLRSFLYPSYDATGGDLTKLTPVEMATTVLLLSIPFYLLFFGRGKRTATLHPKNWTDVRLTGRRKLSPDTNEYTFTLPSSSHILGLPVGQHVSFMYKDGETGDQVMRSYTPTEGDENYGVEGKSGTCRFVIKTYRPNERFPEGGKMSQHLADLPIGSTVSMRGPKGHMSYLGNGSFTIQMTPRSPIKHRTATHFGMIAGGTGLTPMLQVIKAIFRESSDVKISLLYANQTPADILCREELEKFAAMAPDRFNYHFTVDRLSEKEKKGWKGSVGFIDEDMIRKHLPGPSGGSAQILMCGPPPMIKFACLPNLAKVGYEKDEMFTF